MDNFTRKLKKTIKKILKLNWGIFNGLTQNIEVNSVAVLYYIPEESNKIDNWNDGFTKAIKILSEDYDISMINLAIGEPTKEKLDKYDFILVKSNWNWIPDTFLRKKIKSVNALTGLMISGVNPPPKKKDMLFYDILYFETFWYSNQIKKHPKTIHAFGIDRSQMFDTKEDKLYNWITVGAFTAHKRHELFTKKQGRKISIGETHYPDSLDIIEELKNSNVEVIDFVSYDKLRSYINQSERMYVPAKINGGGERAVLEARACCIPVEVEPDNPKLQELLNCPIWDQYYYAIQLKKGFDIRREKKKNPYAKIINSSMLCMVGRESYHNGNFRIKGDQHVKIGSYCAFGENIRIVTSNHDYNYPAIQGWFFHKNFDIAHPGETRSFPTKERTKGPVHIGSDVWLADNVTVLSGVTIGNGCCIAAGSVVTKDIPDYAIAGGVPAKVLGYRYSDEVIQKMQTIRWWKWSLSKIKKNKEFFTTNLNRKDFPEIK